MDSFSYLLSVIIFSGIPFLLEFIFGYHLLKPFFKSTAKMATFALLLVPILEGVAFRLNAWYFNPEKNLQIIIFGDVLETYIYTIFVFCTVAFAVYIWTDYEDKKLPIIHTSIKDALSGQYAIWRKKK